ncbi:uncharacterized protein TNCV_3295591 [Trichonephila clavipes]|uniref:Uncharacterized protein n=1 Tax=Trichonephila clavipes TaxID=2585209 RepID=A0A8X6T2Q7_TRICX|nr:uncharacterized protein TNCV_3295591 [Trichonephila clavipes]
MGCPTRLPKLSQICLLGDKSGDQAGQRRVVTVRRQSCDTLTALSGSIPLQSSFLVRGTTPNGDVDGWALRAARNGRRDPKCPSARLFRMVRKDTGAPSEGSTCAWMAADEAVGCKRSFLTMWRSSQRLICRGRPGPGLHVNDISRNHWSQHLLTTQKE